MPARRKSPRRSKSRSKSRALKRRSSGKARTSRRVTRRRSPKRTYKGTDTRLYGMNADANNDVRYTCDAIVDSEGNASAECVNLNDIESLTTSRLVMTGKKMEMLRHFDIVETNGKSEGGPFLRGESQYKPFEINVFKIHL